MFGNMGDMMGMMGKMKDIQARMQEAQEQLGSISESAEAGAGLVRVTINGQKKITKLEIDDDLIKPDDKEMMQDLIIAAMNKAMENIEPRIKKHLQKSTEGMIPNIPGLDLGNLMK